ncbi:unnamed protein product, partial [Amoebophrya sp. A25]
TSSADDAASGSSSMVLLSSREVTPLMEDQGRPVSGTSPASRSPAQEHQSPSEHYLENRRILGVSLEELARRQGMTVERGESPTRQDDHSSTDTRTPQINGQTEQDEQIIVSSPAIAGMNNDNYSGTPGGVIRRGNGGNGLPNSAPRMRDFPEERSSSGVWPGSEAGLGGPIETPLGRPVILSSSGKQGGGKGASNRSSNNVRNTMHEQTGGDIFNSAESSIFATSKGKGKKGDGKNGAIPGTIWRGSSSWQGESTTGGALGSTTTAVVDTQASPVLPHSTSPFYVVSASPTPNASQHLTNDLPLMERAERPSAQFASFLTNAVRPLLGTAGEGRDSTIS